MPGLRRPRALTVTTRRGSVLDGALFPAQAADTVVISITGIHGNFYSNPFYVTFGRTLNRAGIDFVYAQTNDAFNEIPGTNAVTGQEEVIGSWNEDFAFTDEDLGAWLDYAEVAGYRRIILAGHSLGANKVIYYLARHHDERVEHFLLLSPANLRHLTNQVTAQERAVVRDYVDRGLGEQRLPFPLMGWVPCRAETARQWLCDNILDNVHVEADADFSQVAAMRHTGAMLIGTYDRFTYGDPAGFLATINDHAADPDANELVLIQGTGHTYQGKDQEVADAIVRLVRAWA